MPGTKRDRVTVPISLRVIFLALLAAALMLAPMEPVLAQEQSADPPAKPTGLTGTVAHASVSLAWDDPEDSSTTGYQILRRKVATMYRFQ